ncbi:MAG: hypothetical protein WBB29_18255, partial [Geitlerinemataceae cyanobacterium]
GGGAAGNGDSGNCPTAAKLCQRSILKRFWQGQRNWLSVSDRSICSFSRFPTRFGRSIVRFSPSKFTEPK